jgi:diaminohydroxyphosphoribosylaminopyrimidine deaminase / 5-amino-6-(5-phosphoribosylamino)uracil reductase
MRLNGLRLNCGNMAIPSPPAGSLTWTGDDYRHMAQAIRLARQGLYSTDPNPRVGCVLVKAGRIVGMGWHQRAGEPHAEIHALTEARERAQGATCYVSLEPCCHYGRTPPCTKDLIEAGIMRVIVAMTDPNPAVNAQGLATLSKAGILVESGLLEDQARLLNPGFIKRMQTGLPYVRGKIAMSLDGRTAMASGESQWITSFESRQDVQRLRAQSSAIMTGIGTVLADDPALTVREAGLATHGREPMRVVLDSQLRLPQGARILKQPGQTLVLTRAEDSSKRASLTGAEIVELPSTQGRVDLRLALQYLAGKQVNEVLLEAGPILTGALLQAELVDELVIYMAPKLLGSNGRGIADLPGLERLADHLALTITEVRKLGVDVRITAKVQGRK